MGNIPPDLAAFVFFMIVIVTIVVLNEALKPHEYQYLCVAKDLKSTLIPGSHREIEWIGYPVALVCNDMIAILYWDSGSREGIEVLEFVGRKPKYRLDFTNGELQQNGDSNFQFRRKYEYAEQLIALVRRAAV